MNKTEETQGEISRGLRAGLGRSWQDTLAGAHVHPELGSQPALSFRCPSVNGRALQI